ncbi:conserved hypothetical protein [Ricinus communis]|uniref:Uncharacterized protein n=1 Tax=Ricinus communis TaxID=3988 RepID=B9TLU3_RICCO|nr:conserved hypothetical protein [Ricinus communis]
MACPAISARMRKIRKITSAMPKRTRAIVAVAAEMPEKPKKPAISEMTKNMRAHLSMEVSSVLDAEDDAADGDLFPSQNKID